MKRFLKVEFAVAVSAVCLFLFAGVAVFGSSSGWQKLKVKTDKDLWGVCFVSKKCGWIVDDDGLITVTSDGGKTWKQQKSDTTNHIRDVAFADKKNGCAVCDGGIVLTTTDGGKQWKAKRISEKDLRAVSFPKKDICVVVGDGGTVLKRKFK